MLLRKILYEFVLYSTVSQSSGSGRDVFKRPARPGRAAAGPYMLERLVGSTLRAWSTKRTRSSATWSATLDTLDRVASSNAPRIDTTRAVRALYTSRIAR